MAPARNGERVLGWDLLRGLCALAVAGYHLLQWQEVCDLHTYGSYGVYLFFILSGASLSYTYGGRIESGQFGMGGFLWVRYVRLAPLYLAAMVATPLAVGMALGAGWLPLRMLLNATFLFGFNDPAATSAVVGGWSLGIEAIFYLAFPVFAWAAVKGRAGWALFALLLALQAGWIASTVGSDTGYVANAIAYHQAPAFAAYFMGGCLIGQWRRSGVGPQAPASIAMAAVLVGFVLLLLLNPAQAGDELLGWRGLACCATCFAMAWMAGALRLGERYARLAAHLGDATYGVYLLHPLIFFGVTRQLLPALEVPAPTQWPLHWKIAFTVAVLLCAMVLALVSERFYEHPLRQWSKKQFRPSRKLESDPN